jgi:hypothetical protein
MVDITGKCSALAQALSFTLTLVVIDCHSLGIYPLILLPLLSFSVRVTVSPRASSHPGGAGAEVQERGAVGGRHRADGVPEPRDERGLSACAQALSPASGDLHREIP